MPEHDAERKFYGFWTFEPEIVRETVELAIAHIGQYSPDLKRTLTAHAEKITAAFGAKERDDIGAVVSRVVEYLQTCQQDLSKLGNIPEATPIHEKALDDNLVSNELQAFLRMAQLIDQADATNPMAAAEVAMLSEAMGQLLDLPAWQLKRLRLAALLHRLAPLQGVKEVLEPAKTAVQQEVLHKGDSLPKSSVLRLMPRLQAIAHIITHQTEHWNGSGLPDGLAYDGIPLESRILHLVADFQQRINAYRENESVENPFVEALTECQAKVGEAFDPKLVEALTLVVMGMQQGMSLQANQPKIAAGMWLLDSHPGEELKVIS
jgi:HD-GYP domain-containing protein (c-di-GMP phosphodiesterase class II)